MASLMRLFIGLLAAGLAAAQAPQGNIYNQSGGGGGGSGVTFATPVLSVGNTVLTMTFPANFNPGCGSVVNNVTAGSYTITLASPAFATAGNLYGYYNCSAKAVEIDTSGANFTGVTLQSGLTQGSTGVSGPPVGPNPNNYIQLFTAPAGAVANTFNSTGLTNTFPTVIQDPFTAGASIACTVNSSTGALTCGLDPTQGIVIVACVGAPGNTPGAYQSLCDVPTTGAVFACKNLLAAQ